MQTGPVVQETTSNNPEGEPSPELEGVNQGTVYTWQDGDRTRKVVLLTDQVVQEVTSNISEDGAIDKGDAENIVQKQSQRIADTGPVFRSQSGGEIMTLPGGIILALEPEWDQATVEEFLVPERNIPRTDVGTGLPGQRLLRRNRTWLSLPGTGQCTGRAGRRDTLQPQLGERGGVGVRTRPVVRGDRGGIPRTVV